MVTRSDSAAALPKLPSPIEIDFKGMGRVTWFARIVWVK